MHAFVVQLNIAWESPQANFAAVDRLLSQHEVPAGSLVVLPEMFSTGFSMNVDTIAEVIGGPAQAYLASLAGRLRSSVVGGVVTRAPDGRGLNQAVVFGPGGDEIARYAKIHPFSYAGEHEHFAPGQEVVLFRWGQVQVAPFVCYDLRFPEVYRRAALRGAQVLVTIANFPAPRESHWVTLNVARAIENQAYVVACNRAGDDPKNTYGGRSMVIDPRGEVVADAGAGECVAGAEIQIEPLQAYRQAFPALADARVGFLGLG